MKDGHWTSTIPGAYTLSMVGIFQHATFDMFDDTGGYDAMTPEGLINQGLKTAKTATAPC